MLPVHFHNCATPRHYSTCPATIPRHHSVTVTGRGCIGRWSLFSPRRNISLHFSPQTASLKFATPRYFTLRLSVRQTRDVSKRSTASVTWRSNVKRYHIGTCGATRPEVAKQWCMVKKCSTSLPSDPCCYHVNPRTARGLSHLRTVRVQIPCPPSHPPELSKTEQRSESR